MTERKLKDLQERILALGKYIEKKNPLLQSKFNSSMHALESIFSDPSLSQEEQKKLIAFSKEHHLLSLFQQTYEIYETNLEIEFVRSLLKRNGVLSINDLQSYQYYEGYARAVKAEARLAHITHTDRVAFVGSGPVPMTAILLHELTGALIECIERDRASAELSYKLIQKIGYSKNIHVIRKNAIAENFSHFTVVVLAVMAKPKDVLMRIIWEQVRPGTRIVYRLPSDARQAYYEDTSDVLNHYQKFERRRIERKLSSTLVLLVKT